MPFLASDLVAALDMGLAEAQVPFELAVEYAGYNADRNLLVSKAQHLMVVQRVSCIVAPLNVALFDALAGPCESHGVPLIALTLGEDPLFADAERDNLFVNSFDLWRAAWMCGYVGAKRFGPRAAIAAALHDGGYGTGFAFSLGLEANGGTLLRTVITHQKSRTEDPTPSLNAIAELGPDFIFALYSGKEAKSFLDAYAALDLVAAPLVSLPFLSGPARTTCISAWPESGEFDRRFKAATRHEAHAYPLLAYEAGHLIGDAIRRIGGPHRIVEGFSEALRSSRFDGPRGETGFGNGDGPSPLRLRETTAEGAGVVEAVRVPPLFSEQYAMARQGFAKQGWVNPYLCA